MGGDARHRHDGYVDLGTLDELADVVGLSSAVGAILGSAFGCEIGRGGVLEGAASRDGFVVACAIGARVLVDMQLVGALARLALAVKQAGGTLEVSSPSASLTGLVEFVGLAACFSVSPSRVEEWGSLEVE